MAKIVRVACACAPLIAEATISIPLLFAVSIVNGFYEEIFLIGYLLRALESLAAIFAIGVTLLVRVLYQLYQGPIGYIKAQLVQSPYLDSA
jgi:membrane protease YdiL (CAAX protease family)